MANPGKNLDPEDIWSVESESCRRFDAFFQKMHSGLHWMHFRVEIAVEYSLRFLRFPKVQFGLGILTGLAVVGLAVYSIYLLVT